MSDYAGPARGTNETFKSYKQRQRLSALVLRNRRRAAAGGRMGTRAELRSHGRTGYRAGIKGIKFNMTHVGSVVKRMSDNRLATPSRLKKHQEYVAHIAARKARRDAERAIQISKP
jgi:hypothetical protein